MVSPRYWGQSRSPEQALRQAEPGWGWGSAGALWQEDSGGEDPHSSPGKVSPAKHNRTMERQASCQELVSPSEQRVRTSGKTGHQYSIKETTSLEKTRK